MRVAYFCEEKKQQQQLQVRLFGGVVCYRLFRGKGGEVGKRKLVVVRACVPVVESILSAADRTESSVVLVLTT